MSNYSFYSKAGETLYDLVPLQMEFNFLFNIYEFMANMYH